MARRNLSPEQKRELQRMQRKIAFQLKAEKRWTQEQIARLLGVSRVLVHYWLDDREVKTQKTGVTTNVNIDNSCIPLDCRVKVPPRLYSVIVDRIERGEPQKQVAADLKVSQQAISKIVAKEKKRREVFEERKAGVSQEVQFADRTVKNPASILPAGPTQQRPSVGSDYSPAALTAARQSPSAAPMSM